MARAPDPPRRRNLLPLLGQPPPERADAARNRQALLAAAQRILTESGVCGLSMDRVAADACVGVGTVYRRFGDLSGLAYALLDETERQFQAAYFAGPPPLGPGAPPVTRIRAFLHGFVDRLETEADLHAMGESKAPTARYQVGAYRTARAHLIGLLTSAAATGDLDYFADALLAPLAAGLFLHQRRELGLSTERIKAGLDRVLDGLLQAQA
ncbi:MAG: TetR/AcrR family transcriptional regulator [Actinomycetota bacterium]|nr:TetR/AcrR family transcriptional regulator [Actinomycetota bacterium]